MGCGVSLSVGTTRFTNPAKFNLDGLRFDNPPPPIVATQGIHPAARRLEEKRGPASAIKSDDGGVLVYLNDGAKLDVLFIYPEYNATHEKPPAKCFGKPLSEVHVEQNGTKVSFLQSMQQKTIGVINSIALSIQHSVTNAIGGLLMSDADEDVKAIPQVPSGAEGEVSNSGLPPGDPHWVSIICQLKEYDDSKDVFKPWFRDAAGGVPGVLRLETAGPAAAWATLQPHIYQQRWVLPNERRCNCFADEEMSLPQRLQRAYSIGGGEKWLKELCAALEAARATLEPEILMAAFDTAALATILAPHPNDKEAREARAILAKTAQGVFHDLPKLIEKLVPLLTEEAVKNTFSVYQFPDELFQVQLMLAYVENAMLYNWFRVNVIAETEVGTCYYLKKDPSGKGTMESSLRDLVVRKILTKAEGMAEGIFKEAKEALSQCFSASLQTVLCPKDAGMADRAKSQVHTRALFPDMDDIVKEDGECLDMEMEGLLPKFQENDPALRNPNEIEALLQKWEQEDARPLSERRAEHYKNVTEMLTKKAQEAGLDFDKVNNFADLVRYPFLMPRHFYDFDFLLVFPKQGSKDNLWIRPAVAELNLWPDSHLEGRRTFLMKDLYIPGGGPEKVSKLVHEAADFFDDGSDTVADDDPRKKWGPYPNKDWRGFQCTVRVATDVIYNFNFNLDGHLFLDDNSREVHPDKVFYRRIRFTAHAGPYTYNPLVDMGLVAM